MRVETYGEQMIMIDEKENKQKPDGMKQVIRETVLITILQ